MLQVTQEAPASERPVQDDDTPVGPGDQSALLEVLRRGLCAAGIDHDSWDYVADRCVEALSGAGLLSTLGSAETLEGARRLISSVDAKGTHNVNIVYHFHASHGRTRDKAREIIAAIVSTFGGHHVSVREDHGTVAAWMVVSVDGGGLEYIVYYDLSDFPKEA